MRLTERGNCKTRKELHTPLSHPHLLSSAISATARYDSSPGGGASPTIDCYKKNYPTGGASLLALLQKDVQNENDDKTC